jgi:phosphoribosylformylglycinamidine cyclo-ligase
MGNCLFKVAILTQERNEAMGDSTKHGLYKASGVDVEKGDALVEWLKTEEDHKAATKYGEVIDGIGGFSALFRPNFKGMTDPLLVSGTDGVGTKVLLGLQFQKLEGLGIDLVAMCVNDLYTIGAVPLFFLDYYATGVLDENQFKSILKGIKKGLAQSHAILMGGETAELPGLYEKGHFDLAGFVVGVVDGAKRLGAHRVKDDDVLIAFESSGFHSNGYSLVRKWLAEQVPSEDLVEKVLTPTRIYHEIPEILERVGVEKFHALSNITGGGISGNLVRVMPQNVVCEITEHKIPTPSWMRDFCVSHNASFAQVESVLNLGAGMIAAVKRSAADEIVAVSRELGLPAHVIGELKSSQGQPQVIYK